MKNHGRLFDVLPTVFAFTTSLALTAILILVNSGDDRALGQAVSDVVTEAELVEDRAASAQTGRQAVSPEVVEETSDGLALAEVATGDIVEDADVDTVVEGATANADDTDKVAAVASDDASGAVDESEVALAAAQPEVTVPTTSVPTAVTQPSSATTTRVPRVQTTTVTPITSPAPVAPTTAAPPTSTTRAPTTTTTTTTTQAPTTAAPVAASGSYTVAQIIDGTIGAGDGSNPNEEAPMGVHDAPLYLPQGWNWAQGTTRNAQWGNLGSNQFAEFRCAVIPENGHVPPVDFRVNFSEGAYYQFAGGSWSKAFDVALDSPTNGAYLGTAGRVNADPFASGSGSINWRREADGSYSAPWNAAALMMHFWAGERQSPAAGQTAEFLTSEMRLQQPDGQTVDLSRVRVLFQCGIDYYNTRGGQGTRVPGPGIAKYQYLTESWQPGLWVTLPGNVSASGVADFRTWLNANLPPSVRP